MKPILQYLHTPDSSHSDAPPPSSHPLPPPQVLRNPYDPTITSLWGDYPSTEHLQSPSSIFRFVHFNINGIKYHNKDQLETFPLDIIIISSFYNPL